jgi:hypothetical protein
MATVEQIKAMDYTLALAWTRAFHTVPNKTVLQVYEGNLLLLAPGEFNDADSADLSVQNARVDQYATLLGRLAADPVMWPLYLAGDVGKIADLAITDARADKTVDQSQVPTHAQLAGGMLANANAVADALGEPHLAKDSTAEAPARSYTGIIIAGVALLAVGAAFWAFLEYTPRAAPARALAA